MGSDLRPDETLIDNVKNGDRDSFEELYNRYKAKIYRYLHQLLGSKEAAEDCTQDVFIHLYKVAAQYSPKAKFSSWFYTLARNLAMDQLRKGRVRKSVSLDAPIASAEETASLGDLLASPDLDPEKAAQSAEVIRLMRAGISKLSETDKQLIHLCDMEKMTHAEVGGILGYSAETVTVKLYRARKRLAKILEEMLGTQDLF